jgi:uncharacterized LabA/DUF88 family protein
MASDDLRRQADSFVDLQELGPSIARAHTSRDDMVRARPETVDHDE